MQEDKGNMKKELQTWRSEAAIWEKRLSGMDQGGQAGAGERAALDTVQAEITKKLHSVKLLKRQVIENEAKLSSLLDVVVGDI
jgi:hypothetical protein